MRFLLGLVLILLLAAGGAYVVAGRMAGPPIQIVKPEKIVGVSSPLEVAVEAPGAPARSPGHRPRAERQAVPRCSRSPIRRAPRSSRTGRTSCSITPRDRQAVGARAAVGQRAPIVVTASRKVVYGIRTVASTARQRRQGAARTARASSVVSTHHYINHGGAEMVVYRATPEDVDSGVRRRRRRVSRLPGGGRDDRRASRSPIPRCASRSSRCCTTRT